MTNFDPGGFLVLLTTIPAVIAGVVSIGLAHLVARLGYGDYETNVAAILGALVVAWVGAALVVTTGMLYVLLVVLSMVGAYAATRSVSAASYGWVLGVAGLFVAFTVLAAVGVYQGVDQRGVPQDIISRNLAVSYTVGLLAFGALGGKGVQVVREWWRRHTRGASEAG